MDKEEKAKKLRTFTPEHIEVLKTLTVLNKRVVVMVSTFSCLSLFLRFLLGVPIPDFILVVLLMFTAVISVYVYFLSRMLEGEKTDLSKVENLTFGYYIANIFIYSLVLNQLGGVEWIGVFMFFFMVVEANLILSPLKGFIVTTVATLSYSGVVLLEFFGIIPHHELFILSGRSVIPYKDFVYVLITIFSGAVFGFHYVSFFVRLFARMFRKISENLREERKSIVRAQKELRIARDTLEVRVRARTQELRHLTEDLERQVRERTKELEGKLKELENFQKFAVGREMKMMELKKRIKELEERK
ncbi:MAG: hypothetical protein GF370_04470 [Candidatus Nealsonbacteria bacterium]|nr:hypothetical protein [Candidatus Nealsonbacteria bacterium]